jgi:hypothetical protein
MYIQPARQIHKLTSGVTWVHRFEIVGDNGLPINLSGCTARLTAKSWNQPAPVVLATAEILPLAGVVTFSHQPEQDANWKIAAFDALLFWSDTRIDKLAFGQMRLSAAITTQ